MQLVVPMVELIQMRLIPDLENTKHFAIKHHLIREKVQSGEIEIGRGDTSGNLADILTKPTVCLDLGIKILSPEWDFEKGNR